MPSVARGGGHGGRVDAVGDRRKGETAPANGRTIIDSPQRPPAAFGGERFHGPVGSRARVASNIPSGIRRSLASTRKRPGIPGPANQDARPSNAKSVT